MNNGLNSYSHGPSALVHHMKKAKGSPILDQNSQLNFQFPIKEKPYY